VNVTPVIEPVVAATTPHLTVKAAADSVGVAAGTIYEACRSGELRHYRFGRGRGTIRISPEDLCTYVRTKAVVVPARTTVESRAVAPRTVTSVRSKGVFKHLKIGG